VISISLYGGLEQWFGEQLRLDARSPQEVFWALTCQCPAFYEHLRRDGSAYEVIVDGAVINQDKLDLPILSSISIVPVIAGAGDIGRAILGAVLLVGSFFLPVAVLGISSFAIGALGANMLIGGVTGLLTPKPENKNTNNQSSSLLDAGGLPRSAQGDPIPVLFGLDWWIVDPPIVGAWATNNDVPIDWVPV
jgi:predicted phage tail protein